MKINQRHYVLILLAIICIFATSYAYYFIYKQTLKLAYDYVRDNGELNSEDDKKQKDQELLKMYESTKESRAKVSTFLVHEDKIVSFIETVESVGDSSNTKTELTTIVNEPGVIKAKVISTGTWSGVMTSLNMLENLPFGAVIKNVRIGVSGGADKKGNSWELSLDIEAMSTK